MKVLLINPSWKELVSRKSKILNRPWPPLSLLNCAALLKKDNIDSEVIDMRADKKSRRLKPSRLLSGQAATTSSRRLKPAATIQYMKDKIKEADLTFVTSTPMDRWQCPNPEIMDFISFINSLEQKDKIYLMGAHVTLYPEKILDLTKVRGVIKGQPEFAVLSICQEKIKDRIVEPIEVNLDDIPTPAYEKINLNNYYYELMGKRFALLETVRGCPFSCMFCFKVMYEDKLKYRSIQRIKEDIDYVALKLKAKNVYFIDLEFTIDKDRVKEISDYIIQKGYKFNWCCQTRADAVDYDLLKTMRDSGCTLIHYGVESGSQKVLESVNKRVDLNKIEEVFKVTKELGISTAAFFMFGFPNETVDEMNETINFAKKINPDYASFHHVISYPGTKLFEGTRSEEMFPDVNFSEYSREFILKIEKSAYKKFYLRPRYLISTLFRPKQLLKQLKLFYNIIK